jgi:hypothetical protein
LMFIAFIQKKGWLKLDGQTDYLSVLWESYHRVGSHGHGAITRAHGVGAHGHAPLRIGGAPTNGLTAAGAWIS